MELKICCDAQVKLDRMSNVMEVMCAVGDYQIEDDTLNGDIIIEGNYIKDVMEETFDFKEIVPFTVVFNEKDFVVNNITIQDFSCQEIINQGIECNFNIVVEYAVENKELNDIIAKEDSVQEISEDLTSVENEEESVVETPVEENIKEIPVEEEENIVQVSDEEIKAEIDKKYDNLLNEILEARADINFIAESHQNENVEVRALDGSDDCRSVLAKIPETYQTYRVYYTSKERDLENIAKLEKVSLDKLYKDNKNFDIANKKRIIIK